MWSRAWMQAAAEIPICERPRMTSPPPPPPPPPTPPVQPIPPPYHPVFARDSTSQGASPRPSQSKSANACSVPALTRCADELKSGRGRVHCGVPQTSGSVSPPSLHPLRGAFGLAFDALEIAIPSGGLASTAVAAHSPPSLRSGLLASRQSAPRDGIAPWEEPPVCAASSPEKQRQKADVPAAGAAAADTFCMRKHPSRRAPRPLYNHRVAGTTYANLLPGLKQFN
jgi:hypothetical protein